MARIKLSQWEVGQEPEVQEKQLYAPECVAIRLSFRWYSSRCSTQDPRSL